MNDLCQLYEGEWVKWDCQDQKLILQKFEDVNPLSDDTFIEQYLLKNSTEQVKNITAQNNEDKDWYFDSSQSKVVRRQCTKEKDGETVMEFLWDECFKDDETMFFKVTNKQESASSKSSASPIFSYPPLLAVATVMTTSLLISII